MKSTQKSTQELTQGVIAFLRKYGHLDDPERAPTFVIQSRPEFRHPYLMTPQGRAQPWLWSDPAYRQPARPGDPNYNDNISKFSLSSLLRTDFEKMPLKDIPDSEEYVLIDIGSKLGRRVTRPFAKQKPHVRVYMVDCLPKEKITDSDNFFVFPRNDIAGEELKVKVHVTDDLEDSVNRLMQANGYQNITYIQKWVTETDYDLGIDDIAKTRRVIVTGFLNPSGLGNTTTSVGIQYSAETIYFNNSALEFIDSTSERYRLMRTYLRNSGVSDPETDKLISLIFDPKHSERELGSKYDKKDEGQRNFGNALKFLFVLAQVDLLEKSGYAIELFENKVKFGYQNYNQPSHHVVAKK